MGQLNCPCLQSPEQQKATDVFQYIVGYDAPQDKLHIREVRTDSEQVRQQLVAYLNQGESPCAHATPVIGHDRRCDYCGRGGITFRMTAWFRLQKVPCLVKITGTLLPSKEPCFLYISSERQELKQLDVRLREAYEVGNIKLVGAHTNPVDKLSLLQAGIENL